MGLRYDLELLEQKEAAALKAKDIAQRQYDEQDFDGELGERLEAIYEKFNLDHPEDYKGRSLSVSDVVVLDDKAYYVDDVGFKPLEDFIPLEVKQSRFYDELPKRLSDIAEGKIHPLQDNLLKVGNDALKLNVPPAVMREAVYRLNNEKTDKLAEAYQKMFEKKNSLNKERLKHEKPISRNKSRL